MTNERAEYLKSIATLLQREDDFLLYTPDDSLEEEEVEDDDDDDEPRIGRKLLVGISLVVGMAFGMGLLLGPVFVQQAVEHWWPDTLPVADVQRSEVVRPGWVTAEKILFEPKVTEDGCAVLCGKTQDDTLITFGNGCGTRQIALCQERGRLNADD